MKKIIIIFSIFAFAITSHAQQDFAKDITTAKTSYTAHNLGDAHFALQQALAELDMIIGQEVLKLLPQKMDTSTYNPKDDHVASNVGFVGSTIHRSYLSGTQTKADLEIINNSPLISTINLFLNTPMLGGMMRDENTKMVKVQGYKAKLEKQDGGTSGPTYVLQMPFNTALVTFTVHNSSETEIMAMLNTIPFDKIAALIQ